MHSCKRITKLCAKKVMCHLLKDFPVLQPQIVFSAMWLVVVNFSQKVINVDKAWGVGWTSLDCLLLGGSGNSRYFLNSSRTISSIEQKDLVLNSNGSHSQRMELHTYSKVQIVANDHHWAVLGMFLFHGASWCHSWRGCTNYCHPLAVITLWIISSIVDYKCPPHNNGPLPTLPSPCTGLRGRCTIVLWKSAHRHSTLQVCQRGVWVLFQVFPHLTMKEPPCICASTQSQCPWINHPSGIDNSVRTTKQPTFEVLTAHSTLNGIMPTVSMV